MQQNFIGGTLCFEAKGNPPVWPSLEGPLKGKFIMKTKKLVLALVYAQYITEGRK